MMNFKLESRNLLPFFIILSFIPIKIFYLKKCIFLEINEERSSNRELIIDWGTGVGSPHSQ